MQTITRNSKSDFQGAEPKLGSQSGITILEMVISMLVLTVGLLSVAAAIGYAITVSNKGRNVTNSKLLVVSMLEQVETLRNTRQLTFGQIANAGQPIDNAGAPRDFPGFPTGFLPVTTNPGPDGIFGTNDDLTTVGGEPSVVVGGYTRQVSITSLNTNLKRIQVTLRYPDAGGQMRQLVGVGYLNNDSRTNFR